MRVFVAIPLPEDVRASLAALQQELARSRADVKWVEPANLHLTLKFLDDITEAQHQAAAALLRDAASCEAPFRMSLREVGAFPSGHVPRVVWVGVEEGREAVGRLADAIEQGSRRLGLRKDEHRFSAHVTLGRVRSSTHRQVLADAMVGAAWRPPEAWRISAIRLYQSELSAAGSRYRVLDERALGASSAPSPAPPARPGP